jgi:hypothetical protein
MRCLDALWRPVPVYREAVANATRFGFIELGLLISCSI